MICFKHAWTLHLMRLQREGSVSFYGWSIEFEHEFMG